MELPALMELPVQSLAARDSHLFLWTSGPFVPQSLQLMEAWGFRYSTVAMTWLKLKGSSGPGPWTEADLHFGLGLTFRKNTEIVLLGRRGHARRVAKDVREVIVAPVREHSRKPHEAYARIQRYCDGPYLELFARQHRLGWAAWGNEVGKLPLPRQSIRRRSGAKPSLSTHNLRSSR
jgi:N6-adenosine-specific RNA methylase IME4